MTATTTRNIIAATIDLLLALGLIAGVALLILGAQ
jgi:hypothetical protein